MTEITRERLRELMSAEGADQAPAGAGFWIMSKEEKIQISQLHEPFGGYMLPQFLDGRPPVLYGRHIVMFDTGEPIRFILWCSHCGRFLRWDGTGRCQHCYESIDIHVTFTTDERIDLMPNTGHKERVAADKAAGKSPFVKLPKARPATPSMEVPE